jgi:tetratricopeptide (TPR) repeat protein
VAHYRSGDFPAAAVLCFDILKGQPDQVASLHLLAMTAERLGRLDLAGDLLGRVVRLRPDWSDGHFHLGNVLRARGEPAGAMAAYRRALACRPDHPDALNNLANALQHQGRLDEAIDCYERALDARPDYPDALCNLANALRSADRLDEARARCERVLALQPDHAEAWNCLGLVHHAAGDAAVALAAVERAVALRPDLTDALVNLGNLLQERGDRPGAIEALDRAVAGAPDHARARTNRALLLLGAGRLEAGWRDHEWRGRASPFGDATRDFPVPQWQGEPAGGRTILVHAEQGFGDTLQFCRYVPMLAARGFQVVLEVPPLLLRLMTSLAGPVQVVPHGLPLPPFDLHCPMLSLPLGFDTRMETIPGAVPYLAADPEAAEDWRWRLGTGALNVGLVWAGDPRSAVRELAAMDRRRSMPPDALAPLLDCPGVRFVSLQKGGPAAPPEFGLIDPMADMADFADSAALVAALDLVISVDTAVVHLAGALGRPVWLLNRFDGCWRWLEGRDDSPWYPTLRQFRQQAPGDWPGVVARVRQALGALGRDPSRET